MSLTVTLPLWRMVSSSFRRRDLSALPKSLRIFSEKALMMRLRPLGGSFGRGRRVLGLLLLVDLAYVLDDVVGRREQSR
jgi:hypothetical protein